MREPRDSLWLLISSGRVVSVLLAVRDVRQPVPTLRDVVNVFGVVGMGIGRVWAKECGVWRREAGTAVVGDWLGSATDGKAL